MKALHEHDDSQYPSNPEPEPSLRKRQTSVNKAEAASLQFHPHSGGEERAWWACGWPTVKAKEKAEGEGLYACLHRPLYNLLKTTSQNSCDSCIYYSLHLYLQFFRICSFPGNTSKCSELNKEKSAVSL